MEKYYCISFEGIDKTGKEQILKYVDQLGKHKYVLMDRGIMSNIAYAKLYDRPYEYDIEQFRNWTFVYLTCNEEDWNIRCKLTNEPKIDYNANLKAFDEVKIKFESNNFDVVTINTSNNTPYIAATLIIKHMENKNSR